MSGAYDSLVSLRDEVRRAPGHGPTMMYYSPETEQALADSMGSMWYALDHFVEVVNGMVLRGCRIPDVVWECGENGKPVVLGTRVLDDGRTARVAEKMIEGVKQWL